MMKYITSSDNKLYKETKKLLLHSARVKHGLFIAEGERIVSDALQSGCAEYVIINESYGTIDITGFPVYVLTDKLFKTISDTESTQGIIAVCKTSMKGLNEMRGDLLVICDSISDPGNLGTIIRTAECAGAGGVLLTGNCADPYNPKTVRSTMGSIFRVPIHSLKVSDLQKLSEYDIVAAMLNNSENLYDIKFNTKTAIIIGNEAHGVSEAAAGYASRRVRIPMSGNAESLNASVAAGVIMYEVKRQLNLGNRSNL